MAPTFNKDIAPIVHRSCSPCHDKGKSAPFRLVSYDDVVRNAELVRIQTLSKSMPPLFGLSDFGAFSHALPLSDAEIVLVQRWFQTGLQEGTGSAPEYKPSPSPPSGGVALEGAGFKQVRLEGPRYWMVYVLDAPPSLGSVRGFRFVPGSHLALRYASVAIVPKGLEPREPVTEVYAAMNVRGEYRLGAWAPGYPDWSLSEGYSVRVLPGSKVVVMAMYQPSGKVETADFRIEFQPGKPGDKEPIRTTLEKTSFKIEPYESPVFESTYKLPRAARLVSVTPEARFYCGLAELTVRRGEGKEERAFRSLRWDPYWLGNYMVPTRPTLPAGTTLTSRVEFNNDDRCAANDGKEPGQVFSGNRLEDEVCRMHIVLEPVD